jgi:glycosyltransferase involved in cell wall biosynthesis
VPYDNSFGFLKRIFAFLSFIRKAYQKAATIPKVDLCYATSTPLTVGVIGLLLKRFKKIPFYLEVRDLWPLAPIQMGVIRNAWLQKALFSLEKKLYQEAEKIIALSPGMAQYVEQLVHASKIQVIPNISDCEFFQKLEKSPLLTEQLGVAGKFVITYFGAVGHVNHLDYLVDAASYFQEKQMDGVAFRIVGKGKEFVSLQQKVRQMQLCNIAFIDHVSKFQLKEILSVTDAVYISFAEKPVLETSSPNKFFDALAAGKLCIVNTQGWIKDVIEAKKCGFYTNPQTPNDLYNRLLPYLTDDLLLEEAQKKARNLAEQQFSRSLLTKRFVQLFNSDMTVTKTKKKQKVYSVEK